VRRQGGEKLGFIAALAACLALAACDRPPPSRQMVRDCATKAGAWRYAKADADVVLFTFDRDPLRRPGSSPPGRAEGPPCLACAKALLEQRLHAVEFPILDSPGLERVGRVSLLKDGAVGCDAFRQDAETIISAKYYDLKPPPGDCIGLQQSTAPSARYAVARFSRVADGAEVVELVDLKTSAVLARVVDFKEITGGADEAPIPWTCRDTPSGAPAVDPVAFVLGSIRAPAGPSDRRAGD
jgi:hypothetical protein